MEQSPLHVLPPEWPELLDDPRTVRAIFGDAPSLERVELVSITLDRDGPTVVLDLVLAASEYPLFPPHKWREAGFNRATLCLKCVGVRSVEIRGLETTPILDLEIEREGSSRRVRGATAEMSLDITADWLVVDNQGVKAYLRDESVV